VEAKFVVFECSGQGNGTSKTFIGTMMFQGSLEQLTRLKEELKFRSDKKYHWEIE